MFAVNCLHNVVFPVPEGAEIMKRIPRRSVEDRTGPDGTGIALAAIVIRRFALVLEGAPIRLSSVRRAQQLRHRSPSNRWCSLRGPFPGEEIRAFCRQIPCASAVGQTVAYESPI